MKLWKHLCFHSSTSNKVRQEEESLAQPHPKSRKICIFSPQMMFRASRACRLKRYLWWEHKYILFYLWSFGVPTLLFCLTLFEVEHPHWAFGLMDHVRTLIVIFIKKNNNKWETTLKWENNARIVIHCFDIKVRTLYAYYFIARMKWQYNVL